MTYRRKLQLSILSLSSVHNDMTVEGHGIKGCKAIIPEWAAELYRDLYNHKVDKAQVRGLQKAAMIVHIVERQHSAVAAVASKRREQPIPVINIIDTPPDSVSSVSSYSYNALGFPAVKKKRQRICLGGLENQPSIEASMRRVQHDINFSNNTRLEMAIADLFHCKNISDLIADSPRLAIVIRYVGLIAHRVS